MAILTIQYRCTAWRWRRGYCHMLVGAVLCLSRRLILLRPPNSLPADTQTEVRRQVSEVSSPWRCGASQAGMRCSAGRYTRTLDASEPTCGIVTTCVTVHAVRRSMLGEPWSPCGCGLQLRACWPSTYSQQPGVSGDETRSRDGTRSSSYFQYTTRRDTTRTERMLA